MYVCTIQIRKEEYETFSIQDSNLLINDDSH